jgi:hypothetical protein
MKVYPVAGLLLRDPVKGDFVPAAGREVSDSPFWFRRLACGDASLTPPVVEPGSAPDALSEASAPVVAESTTEPLEPSAELTPAGDEPAETEEPAE